MVLAAWDAVWITVGFVGQAAFTLRFLVQWVVSEKRRESVVPVVFWWLSLIGSVLLLAYAIYLARPPLVVLFAINLAIYLRNLVLLRGLSRGAPLRVIVPLVLGALIAVVAATARRLDWSEPIGWLVLGFCGQIVWNSRFVIQWIASERRGRSVMPEAFWWVSLVGDALLLTYSFYVLNPRIVDGKLLFEVKALVLIAAFLFNPIPYTRNLVLIRRKRRLDAAATAETSA
jgi:lipid-A-disaccharide synthase-like uncharacterized protein